MDFRLTPEQKIIVQTVRDFLKAEVMPLEADMQRAELANEGHKFPDRATMKRLQRKAKELGLWGIDTPEEYGGAGLGTFMSALVWMELGRMLVWFDFGGRADGILFYANEAQKQEYLIPTINGDRKSCFAITEPQAGSDPSRIRMSAMQQPDGDWVLNGEKIFITGGNDADFCIVIAVTDKEKGIRGGFTAFLVDREMGWTSRPIPTMASRNQPAALIFDNARVPNRNVLGKVGQGFNLAMQWIGSGRIQIPARAVGQSQRLLELGVDYARQRVAFDHPIADYQAIQWMIADSEVEISAAKLLVLQAAWKADQGLDARHEVSVAKLHATVTVNKVADRVMQIHGGMGYSKEMPIERIFRDVRVFRIYEGSDEIQKRAIAKDLIKGTVRLGEWD